MQGLGPRHGDPFCRLSMGLLILSFLDVLSPGFGLILGLGRRVLEISVGIGGGS